VKKLSCSCMGKRESISGNEKIQDQRFSRQVGDQLSDGASLALNNIARPCNGSSIGCCAFSRKNWAGNRDPGSTHSRDRHVRVEVLERFTDMPSPPETCLDSGFWGRAPQWLHIFRGQGATGHRTHQGPAVLSGSLTAAGDRCAMSSRSSRSVARLRAK